MKICGIIIVLLIFPLGAFCQNVPMKVSEYKHNDVIFHLECADTAYHLNDMVKFTFEVINKNNYNIQIFDTNYYGVPRTLKYADHTLLENEIRLGGEWECKLGVTQNLLLRTIASGGSYKTEFLLVAQKDTVPAGKFLYNPVDMYKTTNIAELYIDLGYINAENPPMNFATESGWVDVSEHSVWLYKNLKRFILGPLVINIK